MTKLKSQFSAFLYEWTDTITNKKYIGIHRGTEHDGYVCSSKTMLKVYRERPETFHREILAWFYSLEDARKIEVQLLQEVNAPSNPDYYNLFIGGEGLLHFTGGSHTQESKQKIADAVRNRPVSEATRKKRSVLLTGRTLSSTTKEKISAANKGRKLSEETRKKMSEFQKTRNRGPRDDATKLKLANAIKGRKWFHCPITRTRIQQHECPAGFMPGMGKF